MLKARFYLIAAALVVAGPAFGEPIELRFTTQDFAPFNYLANGKVAGPAYEIMVKACAKIAAKCTFDLLPWARAQQEVADGKANGMFVIGWNKARAQELHFTPPLMKTEYGFFVASSNSLNYTGLTDVRQKTVAVYGPSNTSKSLESIKTRMVSQQIEPLRIEMRPDDEAGFKKLAFGRVDAVFSNREVGYALADKLGLRDKVRYAGKTSELDYYIGFNKKHNDPKLLAKFDDALAEVMKDGIAKAILDKFNMQLPTARLDAAKTMRP
jgi:polar amino acid transport system substrate-binding protein